MLTELVTHEREYHETTLPSLCRNHSIFWPPPFFFKRLVCKPPNLRHNPATGGDPPFLTTGLCLESTLFQQGCREGSSVTRLKCPEQGGLQGQKAAQWLPRAGGGQLLADCSGARARWLVVCFSETVRCSGTERGDGCTALCTKCHSPAHLKWVLFSV